MKCCLVKWIIVVGALSWMGPLAGQSPGKPKAAAKADKEAGQVQYQYFVIKAEAGTYGYDVYANGNLSLHQPTIPSQPGNRGFADTAQAGKVARLAMDKMRKGQMPPTIVPEELHELGIPVSGRQNP